jgi:HEPN domain-containing protein
MLMCPYDVGNNWFLMAHKHLKSANILFEHEADNEIVCFHCQQAIEKYFKKILIYISSGDIIYLKPI